MDLQQFDAMAFGMARQPVVLRDGFKVTRRAEWRPRGGGGDNRAGVGPRSSSSSSSSSSSFKAKVPVVDALCALFPEHYETRRQAKNDCRKKLVMVNGRVTRCAGAVDVGDEVVVVVRETIATDVSAHLPDSAKKVLRTLKVKHEDDHLAVIVKPQGFGTASAGGGYDNANAFLPHLLKPTGASTEESGGAMHRPRPCHRLDKATGGLLVCAKTSRAMEAICDDFRDRKVRKKYFAVIRGLLPRDAGTLDTPLDGKPSTTEYVVEHKFKRNGEQHAYVTLTPKTGRNQQIRRHLAGAGCPIVGDRIRCPGAKEEGGEMLLWACKVGFRHPITGEQIELESDPPEHFYIAK